MIDKLIAAIRGEKTADEEQLAKDVRQERMKLNQKRRRVDKVLADFHKADAAIRGNYRGTNDA